MVTKENEKEIRKRQLHITEEIFRFCQEKNIRCFLTGGSLLGAIKLHQIIPGDKDVDIGMLREDYEKFLAVSHELPKDLEIIEARKSASYNWLFAKVFQKGTQLIAPKKETVQINRLLSIQTDETMPT